MINIKKQDRMLKALEPSLAENIFLGISFVFSFINYDLPKLEGFSRANFIIFLFLGIQYLCWSIWCLIVALVRKSYIKHGKYVPTDEVFFKNNR